MRIGPNPIGTVSALIMLASAATQTQTQTQAAIVVSHLRNVDVTTSYTDSSPLLLDVDNNGSADFQFYYPNTFLFFEGLKSGDQFKQDPGTGDLFNYSLGQVVQPGDPATSFLQVPLPLVGTTYAGFEFSIEGNIHQGWMQFIAAPGDSTIPRLVVAAWESTPGAGISAGAVPELPAVPLVFGLAAVLTGWVLRRPSEHGQRPDCAGPD